MHVLKKWSFWIPIIIVFVYVLASGFPQCVLEYNADVMPGLPNAYVLFGGIAYGRRDVLAGYIYGLACLIVLFFYVELHAIEKDKSARWLVYLLACVQICDMFFPYIDWFNNNEGLMIDAIAGLWVLLLRLLILGMTIILLFRNTQSEGVSTRKSRFMMLLVGVMAIVVRYLYKDYVSGDYNYFLRSWYEAFRENGNILSQGVQISNYTPIYTLFLSVLAYLPEMYYFYGIKLLSVLFDFVLAIYAGRIVKMFEPGVELLTYASVLFLPTVVANGAMWAQCDSVYCAVIIVSLYYCIREEQKSTLISILFLAVAFALKLQTIFILPVFCYKFFAKKIQWYYFLIIPCMYLFTCVPALIMGRNAWELLAIYFGQAGQYVQKMTYGYPNVYTLLECMVTDYGLWIWVGSIFTVLIMAIASLCLGRRRPEMEGREVILWGCIGAMFINLFLPGMHERYGYVAEILLVVVAMLNTRLRMPMIVWAVFAFAGYTKYFLFLDEVPEVAIAVFRMGMVIYLSYILFYKRKSKENDICMHTFTH